MVISTLCDTFYKNDLMCVCLYPTALKGSHGIFSLTVSGWVGGGKKFVRAVSQKP